MTPAQSPAAVSVGEGIRERPLLIGTRSRAEPSHLAKSLLQLAGDPSRAAIQHHRYNGPQLMLPAGLVQPRRATALLGGLLAALCLALPAQGQVIRDGSIGPGMDVQPVGPHYEIPASMGEQAGGNLFHGFEDFSLHTVGGVSERGGIATA